MAKNTVDTNKWLNLQSKSMLSNLMTSIVNKKYTNHIMYATCYT